MKKNLYINMCVCVYKIYILQIKRIYTHIYKGNDPI